MRNWPSSTYRVQLHGGFNFEDAAGIADYLAALGITHFYASPYLQSAPGSTHGYDLADFAIVNRELGGPEAHAAFCKRIKEYGLGQILDIVPNHMSLSQNNPYWLDVLENGQASQYANYFDIDWNTSEERLRNKILLPILEDQYGVILDRGSIRLVRNEERFEIALNEMRLPVASSSLSMVLAPAARSLRSDKLAFLADSFSLLAAPTDDNPATAAKAQRDCRVLLETLRTYLQEDEKALGAIDEAIADINGDVDALDAFLQLQHYRLAYWKVADQDLGYRRFFDVNSLIGVRVEDKNVFLDTHKLILEWLDRGVLDGVRIDHVDGLLDPQQYLEWLRNAAPDAWIVVEKILARNEDLASSWPVQGTTGYELLNLINGVLISPDGLATLDEIYREDIGRNIDFPVVVHEKKVAVTAEGLGSDVNRLTSLFVRICENARNHRDQTRAGIRHAIREIACCFQIYRTYVSPARDEISELDAAVIQNAIDVAAAYRPDLDRSLFDFIADVLLLRRKGKLESEFLQRFQQFTSPVMAKGLEDTALYCYNRLVGMNDVGSNLANPIVSVDDFHRANLLIQQSHPDRMVTLTTHDTKRGEDIRARLLVLSEIPEDFRDTVRQWSQMNAVHRSNGLPDPNTEYLYYQTLIGAWPIDADRAIAYMVKATREAKEQTSWTQNNKQFEESLENFIRVTLGSKTFCDEVELFVKRIDYAGRVNSLTQTLLKYTVPGIPDLYQGSELWDHRLVDPDNRTPVDFNERRKLLNELSSLSVEQVMDRMDEGVPKLWTIHHALVTRHKYPQCFDAAGTYAPFTVSGDKSDHVVAFTRGESVATVVPRLTLIRKNRWDDTVVALPKGNWINVLTRTPIKGGAARVADLLSAFPVALLTKKD